MYTLCALYELKQCDNYILKQKSIHQDCAEFALGYFYEHLHTIHTDEQNEAQMISCTNSQSITALGKFEFCVQNTPICRTPTLICMQSCKALFAEHAGVFYL